MAADLDAGAQLTANRNAIGSREKFRRIAQANGTVALQALANNLYVAADLNAGGVLIANRGSPSTWEQFTFTGL